jgi:integrase
VLRSCGFPKIWPAIKEVAQQPLRDAIDLAVLTGMRRADLVAVRWDEVGDLAIHRTAAKRSRRKRYRVTIPRLPELDTLLEALRGRPRKTGVETVLVNGYGKSWTGDGLNSSFHDARGRANEGEGIWHIERDPSTGEDRRTQKRLHDLRGTFATRIIAHPSANLTNREVADIMGWSPEQVDQIRKRYVDDTAIVVELARRLAGNR